MKLYPCQKRVYSILLFRGKLTVKELSDITGKKTQQIRPRLIEMSEMGIVKTATDKMPKKWEVVRELSKVS